MNDTIPLDFDFITDEQFRNSLVNDYRELKACEEGALWKSVYVLAGSIVEALLVEYLVISGIRPGGRDPLEIDLAKAIEACEVDGVLQRDTASLCTVIRGYRNLIHPGRVIRLNQEITPEGALIASKLVSLIAKEISKRRKINYGPTAEQIIKKVKSDQHALVVLGELLADAKEHERKRLVEVVIPEAIASEETFMPDHEILERLRLGYRQALESLPTSTQKLIAEKFATLIRNDSNEKIQNFGDAFFSTKDIALLEPRDSALVIRYLLTRLNESSTAISPDFLRSVTGIGKFITADGAADFADTLIKLARSKHSNEVEVMNFVMSEYDLVPEEEGRENMVKRLHIWVEFAKEKGYSEGAQKRFQKIVDSWFDIPF